MIEPTNLIVSVINLISLIVGGIAIGLIFKLTRKNAASYLYYFFIFLVCAAISGFCDWIVYNWVRLLIPGTTSVTSDLIYHILWDLIGFPAALFALFFLVKALNDILGIRFSKLINFISISFFLFFTLLSYFSFYLRLQETENLIRSSNVIIYTYVIPIINLSYLAFALFKSSSVKANNITIRNFILLLFFSFSLWYFLSLVPLRGIWRHQIIFTYYLALFLPALYLYVKREKIKIIQEFKNDETLEGVFVKYEFTSREKELVFLLLEGKSNQEISEKLFLSLQTVKNYVSNIYKKVGLKNRVQFVNFIRDKQ